MHEFHQLHAKLNQEQSKFELKSYDYFAEVKRQIDIYREELKSKIDTIALAMIKQAEEHAKLFAQKLDSTRCFKELNTDRERYIFEDEFRHLNTNILRIKQLKADHLAGISYLQSKLEQIKFMSQQMSKCGFVPSQELNGVSFGTLNLRNPSIHLASSSFNSTIQIWDLERNEYIRTLVDNAQTSETTITSIDVLPNGHLVSCSNENTLQIWNPRDGVCLKTLVSETSGNFFLKVLSDNRVACGTQMQIHIWDMNTFTCAHTLDGHTGRIYCFAHLPDGTLVSGSLDRTIKFWNLSRNVCVKTLHDHTDSVFSLLLLKNGRLASGSRDKTIRVWDLESGACVQILCGHTRSIGNLDASDQYELISCSNDSTIKIWDLERGDCIRTLVGHVNCVYRIKIAYENTLVSGSVGQIKVWDLKSGKCIHTLESNQSVITGLCFI